MRDDEQRDGQRLRRANVRTALALASVAAALFAGIVMKYLVLA